MDKTTSGYKTFFFRFAFLAMVCCLSMSVYGVSAFSTRQDSRVEISSKLIEENDTVYHDPRKASLYALVPGLGQIYNRKYWKLPIVYAGFGTLGYFINWNQVRFKEFKQAYKDFPDYNLDYPYPLSREQIERGMNYHRRYRDLSILGTFGFYILQIIDASVDAHLFDWNVGEDISLHWEPSFQTPGIYNGTNTFGLRACISF
jgi:hypothetical protein